MILLSAPIYYHFFTALVLLVIFVAMLPFLTTSKREDIPTALVPIGLYYNDLHMRITDAQTPEALHQLRVEIETFYNRKYSDEPAICNRRVLRKSLLIAHARRVNDLSLNNSQYHDQRTEK